MKPVVSEMIGTAVSPGITIGKLFVYEPYNFQIEPLKISLDEVSDEVRLYDSAIQSVSEEIDSIINSFPTGDSRTGIFEAHKDILEDEEMDEEIRKSIIENHYSAEWSVESVFSKYAQILSEAKDALIAERAADIKDVKKRLLRRLKNLPEMTLSLLPEPVIVAAKDLLPSDTATIDKENVLGIITEQGGITSHSAILAKSFGIPAVLGVRNLISIVRNCNDDVILDALSGRIYTNPTAKQREEYNLLRKKWLKKEKEAAEFLYCPGKTKDGLVVDIGINIGSPSHEELEGADYSDFIGLFRTEFLFMERPQMPTEEEQVEAYSKALMAYRGRPVTIRTLDIGGDKTLPYLYQEMEENPFLGNRALRLCFSHPEIFETQLRAMLRASVYGNLWIMFPMIGSMEDFRRAKQILDKQKAKLDAERIPYSKDVKVGVMIEIPSIALMADCISKEVDFASIGSNDLCQYLMAADRMNPTVSEYYQKYSPALFRIIGMVADAFTRENKPLCICGELGGDRIAAPVLVGLGVKKLSMNKKCVAGVKQVLSMMSSHELTEMSENVKRCQTMNEVVSMVKKALAIAGATDDHVLV